MYTKHDNVHLLIISEKGRVKSRKISISLVKYLVIVFVFLFLLTSIFTILYFRGQGSRHMMKDESITLLKEIDRFRSKIEEKELEIKRLRGMVSRLKEENADLKRHIIGKNAPQKKAERPREQSVVGKDLKSYQGLLSQIEGADVKSAVAFHIRNPKIVVSHDKTIVYFKLYKDGLKKISGRYILLGVYKPKIKGKAGSIVAFPRKGVSNFKLRPDFGWPFKMKGRPLLVQARLPNPKGISRFSEFHVLVFDGIKKEVLFHEQFKVP